MIISDSRLSSADKEPDDYLIELMGLKNDFPEDALDAYGKIYSRYWDVMFTIAKDVTRDDDTAMDLLADTFNMVYQKAATFKKGKVRNKDNIRSTVKKWMTTIMQRIFYDLYLDEAYKKSVEDNKQEESYIIGSVTIHQYLELDYDEFINRLEVIEDSSQPQTSVVDEPAEESYNLLKVREYVAKLSERDRDIVLTIYDFYVPGKYTPAEVLLQLERRWGTTRQNIRKILEKFRKAIKEELQPKLFIRK